MFKLPAMQETAFLNTAGIKFSGMIINLYVIIPFFLSSTISFATPFPAASSFVNASQSSNLLNRAHSHLIFVNVIVTEPGFSKKKYTITCAIYNPFV